MTTQDDNSESTEEASGTDGGTCSYCNRACGQPLPGGLCEKSCQRESGHGGPHNCGEYHS